MDFINELNALKSSTSSTSGQSTNPFISELNALPPIKKQPASLNDLSYVGLPTDLSSPNIPGLPYFPEAVPTVPYGGNPYPPREQPTDYMLNMAKEWKPKPEGSTQLVSPFTSTPFASELSNYQSPGAKQDIENTFNGVLSSPPVRLPMVPYELSMNLAGNYVARENLKRAKMYGMPTDEQQRIVDEGYANNEVPMLGEELNKAWRTYPGEIPTFMQTIPEWAKNVLAEAPETAALLFAHLPGIESATPGIGRWKNGVFMPEHMNQVYNDLAFKPGEANVEFMRAKNFQEQLAKEQANKVREQEFANYEAEKAKKSQQVKNQEDQILKYQAQQATQQPLGVVEPPTDFIPAQKDVGALIRQTPYQNKFIPSAEEVQAEMEALRNQPAPESNGIPNLYQFMGNKSEQIPDANLLRQSRQGNIPPIPKDINYIQPDTPIQHRFISDAIPPDIPVASEEIALRNEMANLPNKFGMNERLPDDPLDVRDVQIQKRIREEQERELFKQGLMGKNAEFAKKVGMSERLPDDPTNEPTNDFIDELNALSKETGQNKQVKKPTTFEPLPTLPQEQVKFADEVASPSSPVSPSSSLANENVKRPTVPTQPAQTPPQAIPSGQGQIIPERLPERPSPAVATNKQSVSPTSPSLQEKTTTSTKRATPSEVAGEPGSIPKQVGSPSLQPMKEAMAQGNPATKNQLERLIKIETPIKKNVAFDKKALLNAIDEKLRLIKDGIISEDPQDVIEFKIDGGQRIFKTQKALEWYKSAVERTNPNISKRSISAKPFDLEGKFVTVEGKDYRVNNINEKVGVHLESVDLQKYPSRIISVDELPKKIENIYHSKKEQVSFILKKSEKEFKRNFIDTPSFTPRLKKQTEPATEPTSTEAPAFQYEPFTPPEQKEKLTELNMGVNFVKKIKNFVEELRGKRFGSSTFPNSSASPTSNLQGKGKIGEADVYVKDRFTRWFKQNIWKGNSTPKFQSQFDTVANNITAETQKVMDEVVHDLIFEKTFDQLKPWEKALHNNQFTRNFMKMLPHNEQVLMGDMMNADKGFKVGDTVTEASYVTKLKELGLVKDARTESLAKRAYKAAEMMDNQAKQALEQGLIKDKEYAEHYMKYMPRLYDRYEMGSISKKGKFELNKIVENKSLPEQTRNMAKALLEPDVYRSELEAFSKHVQDVAKNAEFVSPDKASGYIKIGNNWNRYGSDLQGKWLRKDVYYDLNNQINKFKQINHIIDEADRRVSKLTTYNASPTKLNLGEYKERQNIPKQIRDTLGEIHTPGYPIAKRTAQTIRDLQLDDFFKNISKDPESVLPLETQERLAGQGNEIVHNGKYYKLMPNSDTENWGLLRNRYVESGIADELISTKNGLDKTLETIEMITRPIKYGLVPLNHISHVVQWGSNGIFANLAGVPIWEVPGKFAKKSGDLLTRSPLYREALKNGVLNGAYFKEAAGSLYKFYNVIATGGGIDKVTEIMKGLWHLPGQVFSASDQIAKLAVYDHVKNISIKNGMSEANAIAHAVEMSKMIPDYHRMPKLVRIADVFSPFIAFTVKSNEIMAKAAFSKDPNMLLRTWKYPAMAGGLTAYLIANGMLKPEDIPANRNKFEEYPGSGLIKDPYVRGLYDLMGDAMSGQNIYLPDGKGGANKVSTGKFSPIGNQVVMNAEKTGLQREFGLSNNLAVKAYQPIFEGKDQYGNKLKDEERIPYAVNQFVAPVRNINRIGKDLEGDAKNKIPPRSIGNVIAKDVLGVDVSPVISPANRFSNANEFYFKKKKIQDEISKIEKNGLKGVFGKQSAETAKEAIAKRRKELKQLEDEFNSRFVK